MTFKCLRRLQVSTAWKPNCEAWKRLKTGLNAQTTAHWLVNKAARPRFPLEPTLLRTGCTQVRVLGLSPTRTSPCLNTNIKVGREREHRWPWIRPCLLLVFTYMYAKQPPTSQSCTATQTRPLTTLQRLAYDCPFLADENSHVPYATSSARSSGFRSMGNWLLLDKWSSDYYNQLNAVAIDRDFHFECL